MKSWLFEHREISFCHQQVEAEETWSLNNFKKHRLLLACHLVQNLTQGESLSEVEGTNLKQVSLELLKKQDCQTEVNDA